MICECLVFLSLPFSVLNGIVSDSSRCHLFEMTFPSILVYDSINYFIRMIIRQRISRIDEHWDLDDEEDRSLDSVNDDDGPWITHRSKTVHGRVSSRESG